jgi:hypothetical protein
VKLFPQLALARQRQRVHDLMRNVATRAGDAEASRVLADYYTDAALNTDPHTDWWIFAELKQNQVDYQDEHTLNLRRYGEAQARLNAAKAKLKEMQ